MVRVYKVAALYYTSCACGRMWHISVYWVGKGKEKGEEGDQGGAGTKGVKRERGGAGGQGRGGGWKRVSPLPPLGCLPLSFFSTSSETSHNLLTFSAFVTFQFE